MVAPRKAQGSYFVTKPSWCSTAPACDIPFPNRAAKYKALELEQSKEGVRCPQDRCGWGTPEIIVPPIVQQHHTPNDPSPSLSTPKRIPEYEGDVEGRRGILQTPAQEGNSPHLTQLSAG